ncbi:MAG: hypothetical protein ACXU82_16145 [Caulobacteraceae bacterium]
MTRLAPEDHLEASGLTKAFSVTVGYSALLAMGLWSLAVTVPVLWICVGLSYAALALKIVVRAASGGWGRGFAALILVTAIGGGLGFATQVLVFPLIAKVAPWGFVWTLMR